MHCAVFEAVTFHPFLVKKKCPGRFPNGEAVANEVQKRPQSLPPYCFKVLRSHKPNFHHQLVTRRATIWALPMIGEYAYILAPRDGMFQLLT